MIRPSISALLLALAPPSPLFAQAMVQAVPGSTDADRLADQMRRLAVSPNDLDALMTAGELSLKLDDLGAAASFFTRAERVDPRSGRVKAGQGAILVHAERPGEALRYFAQAEALGRQPASFAADRGLAYDLLGENDRAQRDYRLALRTAPDDETLRRYALSLGIAGKREVAEQQLQPLLRKSDRGAWRAHAFIQAMNGNVGEASHIATTMMPPGTAAGLQPFFERLPALSAADRAFAVHFGNARSSPQRIADARLAPPLAALAPDPTAPRLSPAAGQPVALAATDRGKRKKNKGAPAPVVLAAVSAPQPSPVAQAPAYVAQPVSPPVLAQQGQAPSAWPGAGYGAATRTRGRDESAALANAQAARLASSPVTPGAVFQGRAVAPTSTIVPGTTPVVTSAPVTLAAAPPPERDVRVAAAPAASPGFTGTVSSPVRLAATTTAVTPTPSAVVPAATPSLQAPVSLLVQAPPPPVTLAATAPIEPIPATAQPFSGEASIAPATVVSPPGTAPAPRRLAATPRTDTAAVEANIAPASRAWRRSRATALASIVGDLPVPASELGVRGPRRAAAATADASSDDLVQPARAGRRGNARTRGGEAAPEIGGQPDEGVASTRADHRGAAARKRADGEALAAAEPVDPARTTADKRAADRKAAADKKKLAEAKEAAAKKAEEAREAAAEKKLARANPERIWVQVQGGAYKGDLPKAWAAVKAKGGDAFAGQTTGWTTPLRFTNRVLAGPFKTNEEARAFVNRLTAKGMGAFTFTSDAGQVVTKLPAK